MDSKKILAYFLIAVVFGGIGYILGNLFPTFTSKSDMDADNETSQQSEDIVQLRIFVLDESGNSIPDLEVDVADSPGQPPEWGVAYTDEEGVAEYDIEPGSYFVYFNEMNFPDGYEFPDAQPLKVSNQELTEHIVTLHPNR